VGNIAVRKRLIKWIDESIYNGQGSVEYRAASVDFYVGINRERNIFAGMNGGAGEREREREREKRDKQGPPLIGDIGKINGQRAE